MRPLKERLSDWIKHSLLGKSLLADDRYYEDRYGPEDAKAIREALRHPAHRKLVGLMEQKQWTKAYSMLREDHATQQLFNSTPGSVIGAVYLPTQPPIDLVLDFMVSERNAAHWYLARALVFYYSVDYQTESSLSVNRAYIMHALIRHFRPDDLILKPKLHHYPQTDRYRFALDVAITGDEKCKWVDCTCAMTFFNAPPCCTYSLLTEAGFKASPLEYITSTNVHFSRVPDDVNAIAQTMNDCCQDRESSCASLAYLARNAIRTQMASLDMLSFQHLPLPWKLEKYVSLEYMDCPDFGRHAREPIQKPDFHDFRGCKAASGRSVTITKDYSMKTTTVRMDNMIGTC